MKTYVFQFEIEQDDGGIREAEIPALPGCAVWGYTKQEALDALQEGAKAYLEVKLEHGDSLPTGIGESAFMDHTNVVTITL